MPRPARILVGVNTNSPNDRIVWVDCEMTGLDKKNDATIEVAVLVTDGELKVLGEGVDVVIRPPAGAVERMNDVVTAMHTASGLLDELDGGVRLDQAQQMCLEYVRGFVPEPGRAPLAGNSVGTDRAFLERDLPEFEAYLSYRTIDVSSLKELAKRWFPRVYFNSPAKHGGHRALADIRESIAELRFYREALFLPQPGPSTDEVRRLAQAHVLATQPAEPVSSSSPSASTDSISGSSVPRGAADDRSPR